PSPPRNRETSDLTSAAEASAGAFDPSRFSTGTSKTLFAFAQTQRFASRVALCASPGFKENRTMLNPPCFSKSQVCCSVSLTPLFPYFADADGKVAPSTHPGSICRSTANIGNKPDWEMADCWGAAAGGGEEAG